MTEAAPPDLLTAVTKQVIGWGTRFAFYSGAPLAARRRAIEQLRHITMPADGCELSTGQIDTIPYEFWTPANLNPGRIIIYSHGGGYMMFSPGTHRGLASRLAQELSAQAIVFDYRLAPEHKFPAAIDDALTVYRYVLSLGYNPRNVIFAGDSAGGGITFGLMIAARDAGLPLPGLAIGLSPWVDMTTSGFSMRENADKDVMLKPDGVAHFATEYMGSQDPKHPYASPLFADLKGLPPIMLQAAGDEILRDDSVRLAAALREAGVKVELDVWPGLFHVFEFAWRWLPQAESGIQKIGDFVRRHYGN